MGMSLGTTMSCMWSLQITSCFIGGQRLTHRKKYKRPKWRICHWLVDCLGKATPWQFGDWSKKVWTRLLSRWSRVTGNGLPLGDAIYMSQPYCKTADGSLSCPL